MSTAATVQARCSALAPSDLPTPPAVVLRVLHACADPDIDGCTLEAAIGHDAALVAELLRLANSPFFGGGRSVSTIAQAVAALGMRALRNFVLFFSARESLRSHPLPEPDALTYWETVLQRAVGAHLLAEAVSAEPGEAFTIALLQDVGLMVLLQSRPQQAATWSRMCGMNPDQRLVLERELFGVTHDQVARELARSWALPEELHLPLARHHDRALDDLPPASATLARIAACADWIAAVYNAEDKRLAAAHCRKLMADDFCLTQQQSEALFEALPQGVTAAAAALGVRVAPQQAFDKVLDNANRRLIQSQRGAPNAARRLERALRERERLAEELLQAYQRLAQLAYYDSLTALVNRRRFEELLPAEIARHSRSAQPLSIVMIDLDHFKHLNDNYGHLFGDTVLQSVAGVLKSTLRGSDVAARVGGEEMCLVLPETGEDSGRIAAERVRGAVAALRFNHPEGEVRLTASLGGCTWRCADHDIRAVRRAAQSAPRIMAGMLQEADRALYQAKRGGRDQVCWAE
ncbi:MAG TPA: GGDEF domain-containing protein [Gammaproteobacteria bacterium]|nr:GGDEF domain-containing protein [Gammaproteobacteria bacterium]